MEFLVIHLKLAEYNLLQFAHAPPQVQIMALRHLYRIAHRSKIFCPRCIQVMELTLKPVGKI